MEWSDRGLRELATVICEEHDIRIIRAPSQQDKDRALALAIGGALVLGAGGALTLAAPRALKLAGAAIAAVGATVTVIGARELWQAYEPELREALFVVYNWARRLELQEYVDIARLVLTIPYGSRVELAIALVDILSSKFGSPQVHSSLELARI